MKDTIDSLPADRPVEAEGFANRKLIRPSLNRNDHNHGRSARRKPTGQNVRSAASATVAVRNPRRPEQTNAENFYYQKQMQSKTPMVIVLGDGEEIRGMIEWYDKSCIKVSRNGQTNLLIYKPAIKYMFKEGENSKK